MKILMHIFVTQRLLHILQKLTTVNKLTFSFYKKPLRNYYYPHFKDEETEAYRSKITDILVP